MALRFALRPSQTVEDLSKQVQELIPQIDRQPRVIRNVEVLTTETAIAHGLNYPPSYFSHSIPHCLTMIRQTRFPDSKNVYLRATVKCVVNLEILP